MWHLVFVRAVPDFQVVCPRRWRHCDLRNTGNWSPNDTSSHTRRLASSVTPLSGHAASQRSFPSIIVTVCVVTNATEDSTASCVRAGPLKYAYSWLIGPEMSSSQLVNILFRRVAKFQGATSFVMSIRPRGTARLPLDGIYWNSISQFFFRNCRAILSFIKIWQERRVLYFKTYVCLWDIFSQILLTMRMSRAKVVEKSQNTHFMFSTFFLPRKSRRFWDTVEKCGEMQATDHNIIRRVHFTYWIHKATYTHSEYIIIVVARQQWLHEQASNVTFMHWPTLSFPFWFPCLEKLNTDRRVGHPSKSVYIGIYLIVTTFRRLAVTDYTHIVTSLSLKISSSNPPAWCKQSLHSICS